MNSTPAVSNMNQSEQTLLVPVQPETRRRLLEKRRVKWVDLVGPWATVKCAAVARYIKEVGGIVSVQKIIDGREVIEEVRRFGPACGPDQVMALAGGEDVGMEPAIANHGIHHPLK